MYQHCRNKIDMNGVVAWEEKLKRFVRFSPPLHNLSQIWSIHIVVNRKTKKKCARMQNVRAWRAEPLFSPLVLLLCGVLVAVFVVVLVLA